ncbi:murein biosynthesis integral membrane protein MurJ [bacterium]|nr:murein biosynthesis integral membrane protein MurJ [bacterium]
MTESRSILSSASIISISALGGAIAGFGLQLLVAFHFGASAETDAYFMAQSTSDLLTKLLLGGSIASVFIPLFVERLAQGKREVAWQLGLNVIHIAGAVFVVALLLLWFLAEPFIGFIAPGFDEGTTALTVSLLRVLLPSFLLLFLVDLVTSMLHALKHFLAPALLRIVAPLVAALSIIVLVSQLGIYSLAVGVVIGAAIQLLLVGATLLRLGFSYRFVFAPGNADFRQLLYLVYPFIFSVLMTQAAGIVYRILVSDLSAGSLSALKFSEKIYQLLVIMFLNAVTTVIYPLLAEKAGKRDYRGMQETVAGAIRLIMVVTIPLLIGVALLRQPLIRLIFERGSFTPADTAATAIALLFMVVGLTVNGISSVLGHAVLALKKTRAAVAVSIASQAVAIGLFVILVPIMGHAGLALGGSLVPIAISLLYFLFLLRFIPNLRRILWHVTYAKVLVLAIALGYTVEFSRSYLEQITSTASSGLLVQLLVPTVLGIIVFFGGAYLWRIPEVNDVLSIVQARFTKKRRA